MEIEFLQYLPVDPPGEWTKMRLKDWMHPEHGPLPDELALVSGNGNQFKVAVWLTNKHILVALELSDEDSRHKWSPELRGNILQTFRWTLDIEEEIIQCRTHSFPIPEIEDDEIWRTEIIQTVMKESVKICLMTKVGDV
jgi:hypothetical protein